MLKTKKPQARKIELRKDIVRTLDQADLERACGGGAYTQLVCFSSPEGGCFKEPQ